jgi:hypothetical protein
VNLTGNPCGKKAEFASKGYFAQQMVGQLGALAHNVVLWARDWLAQVCPALARYGILRMVRDVFTVSGLVMIEQLTDISEILLNQADPLARKVVTGLRLLLAPEHVAVSLGET